MKKYYSHTEGSCFGSEATLRCNQDEIRVLQVERKKLEFFSQRKYWAVKY